MRTRASGKAVVTNPTDLRRNLFRRIRQALNGLPVTVETSRGTAVLLAESAIRRGRGLSRKRLALEPKITGAIIGDLDSADDALREHLRLPS